MDKLLAYINNLPVEARDDFAKRAGTTVGYLRKAVSIGSRMGVELCIAIERASDGALMVEDLRPDVDWSYLRHSPAERAS